MIVLISRKREMSHNWSFVDTIWPPSRNKNHESRIPYRKSAARGAWCSKYIPIIKVNNLYDLTFLIVCVGVEKSILFRFSVSVESPNEKSWNIAYANVEYAYAKIKKSGFSMFSTEELGQVWYYFKWFLKLYLWVQKS